jgi:putative transposase
MKAYKFRIYPSKAQEREMMHHLWIAKNLWNELLSHAKRMYRDYGRFPTKDAFQKMTKGSGLYSQTQQEIAHRVEGAIWRFCKLRKISKRAGFPRFKSIDRMKSIAYVQKGFRLGAKLKVTSFGEINIVKHREMEGTAKTLSLKRESSGKWFAIFCVEESPKPVKQNGEPQVGIDLGLQTFATFSDGNRIANPRHIRKYEERLAFLQRRLWRKNRGSRNRRKAKLRFSRMYEKMKNSRRDFLHKTSRKISNSYSMIALENLDCRELAETKLGKYVNDAGWRTFASMLCYKAENAGGRVVFVNPRGTTKTCSSCGKMQELPLSARVYACKGCGMVKDRDLNAAENILARATAGHAGSYACGEGAKETPLEEAGNQGHLPWCATTSLSHERAP